MRAGCLALSYKDTNRIHNGSTLMIYYLLKALPPNTSILGGRFQLWFFEGGGYSVPNTYQVSGSFTFQLNVTKWSS